MVGGMPHWEDGLDEARRHIEFCLDLARPPRRRRRHARRRDRRPVLALVRDPRRGGRPPRLGAAHDRRPRVRDGRAGRTTTRPPSSAAPPRAGVMVATNPPTNLMLQGRGDREPRRRGIPRIKELLAAGVTRGGRPGLRRRRVLSVRHRRPAPGRADRRPRRPARHAGRDRRRAADGHRRRRPPAAAARLRPAPGARADLVVLDAETGRDALREQAPRRWVLRGGRVVAETVREQRLHSPYGKEKRPRR